jgi:protein-S-isoprenylcysteine O-methyltransferase Ste14
LVLAEVDLIVKGRIIVMNTKLVALYFLNDFLGVVGAGVAVFWSAGRIDWWPGWAVIAIWLVWFTAMDIVIFRSTPDLMAERLNPPKGAKSWDRTLLSLLRLTQLARYILGGLDRRYGWTGGFPLAAQIAAVAVCILCCALFTWAMASNAFFSQIVRLQSERGHAVATGGPYRFVRHPGYVGMILFELALSALLASWWAVAAGGLCALLLLIRTALEDRTLQAELPGYTEYARRVRYRLLPGVW